MKNGKLGAGILILILTAVLAGCRRSAAENTVAAPAISPTPTPAVSSPTPVSPIAKIDFRNFTYPWPADLSSEKSLTLKNGEVPFVRGGQMGVTLAKIEYADVTNDGRDEALIDLSVTTGGSAIVNIIYIYTLENEKPKLLWSFDTGDRAIGGLKRVAADNGALVVELFGADKFENGEWKFDYPRDNYRGDGVPTVYTKIRFEWNGRKFAPAGPPETFDYQR